jgi:hypothetical protein
VCDFYFISLLVTYIEGMGLEGKGAVWIGIGGWMEER